MSQEENGFTVHFGASDDENWESMPLEKLNLGPDAKADAVPVPLPVPAAVAATASPSGSGSSSGNSGAPRVMLARRPGPPAGVAASNTSVAGAPAPQQMRVMAPRDPKSLPISSPGADSGSGWTSPPAAAPPASSNISDVDPVLLEALGTPAKCAMVLRFEEALDAFVGAQDQAQLDFPPLGAYQRLVLQRLADRFGLCHEAVGPAVPMALEQGGDGQPARALTLRKEDPSLGGRKASRPATLLINIAGAVQSDQLRAGAVAGADAAPKVMKMMKRAAGAPKGRGNGSGAGSGKGNKGGSGVSVLAQATTVAEKEALYAEAYARIVGDDKEVDSVNLAGGSGASGGSSSLRAPMMVPSQVTQTAAALPTSGSIAPAGASLAQGPPSTSANAPGFGRGRGSNSGNNNSGNSGGPGPAVVAQPRAALGAATATGGNGLSSPSNSKGDEGRSDQASPSPRPSSGGGGGSGASNNHNNNNRGGGGRGDRRGGHNNGGRGGDGGASGRAKMQDRRADMHDPDFQRRQSPHQGAPGYGGYGGGGYGGGYGGGFVQPPYSGQGYGYPNNYGQVPVPYGVPPPGYGYMPQQGAYYPHQGQYPPQQHGYPPQQNGYPPPNGGYHAPQQGYHQQYPPPQQQGGRQTQAERSHEEFPALGGK